MWTFCRAESVPLCILTVAPQASGRIGILARIQVKLTLELCGHQVDEPAIPFVSAETHVAVGRERYIIWTADFHDRHIKRAAAQIVDQDPRRVRAQRRVTQEPLFVAERDGCRRRFVDDVDDFQTGDVARILSGFAPHLVKVSRYRDHDLAEIT